MRVACALLLLLTSCYASVPSAEPVVAARLEPPTPSEHWRLVDWSGWTLCELPCERKVVSGMQLEGPWWPSWSHRVTYVSIPSLRKERTPVVLIPHARVGSPNGALALGITSLSVGALAGLVAWSSCNDHGVDPGASRGFCYQSTIAVIVAGAVLVGAIVWGAFSHEGYVEVRRAAGSGNPVTSPE